MRLGLLVYAVGIWLTVSSFWAYVLLLIGGCVYCIACYNPRASLRQLGRVTMWLLLQAAVIFLVMASNIHWHWTPNPYLAGLVGIFAAYELTLILNWLVRCTDLPAG